MADPASAPDDAGIESLMAQVAELEEDHEVLELQNVANAEVGARKAGAQAAQQQTSIHVSNLDARTSDADLRAIFGSCGEITRITILKDRYTQAPRGFAYVEFANEDAAAKSLMKENQSLHGRPLKVSVKRENVPAHMRGGAAGAVRGAPRGRGGPPNAQNMMAGMMQMMGMAMAGMPAAGAPRGRGRGAFRARGGARGGARGQ